MSTFVTLQFAEGAEAGVEVICLKNNPFVPGIIIIIFIFAWYMMYTRILNGWRVSFQNMQRPKGLNLQKPATSEGFPMNNVWGIPWSQFRQATFRLFFVKLLRIYLHKFCPNKKVWENLVWWGLRGQGSLGMEPWKPE